MPETSYSASCHFKTRQSIKNPKGVGLPLNAIDSMSIVQMLILVSLPGIFQIYKFLHMCGCD